MNDHASHVADPVRVLANGVVVDAKGRELHQSETTRRLDSPSGSEMLDKTMGDFNAMFGAV